MSLMNWFSGKWFSAVHGNNLVYNTCWEDPKLDRVALKLGPDDEVMVITSAGCNALDYALDAPRHIYAVDMNPRQNALLELKMAGIRRLPYETFYQLFGNGHHDQFADLYRGELRDALSPWSQAYWDRHLSFFGGRRSFYFRGSSGSVAHFCNYYIDRVAKIRGDIEQLLAAQSVEEQREIYDRSLRKAFWSGFMKKVVGSDATLSLLGVPRAQRQQVETHFNGGISEFIEHCVETVFARLPIHDNYFWRVYLTGRYDPECCPEYLKRDNFEALKSGLVDRVSVHTNSIEAFLVQNDVRISRFILLDHMDWLSTYKYALLESEWQAIVNRATPNARVLYRSGGMKVEYVDPVRVQIDGKERRLGSLLQYDHDLANELHKKDRVHTYGSFYIADMALA
jgi:S-adenosylmethionine-diacylglycerol 3-amino-3-carboxypropyl transferase